MRKALMRNVSQEHRELLKAHQQACGYMAKALGKDTLRGLVSNKEASGYEDKRKMCNILDANGATSMEKSIAKAVWELIVGAGTGRGFQYRAMREASNKLKRSSYAGNNRYNGISNKQWEAGRDSESILLGKLDNILSELKHSHGVLCNVDIKVPSDHPDANWRGSWSATVRLGRERDASKCTDEREFYVMVQDNWWSYIYRTGIQSSAPHRAIVTHAKPSGEFTEDFGMVYNVKLATSVGRSNSYNNDRTMKFKDNKAVCMEVNGKKFWGFGSKKHDAARKAREAASGELISRMTKANAGTPAQGGFF